MIMRPGARAGRILGLALVAAALAMGAGCRGGAGRRVEHESASLLNGLGPSKVSRRQAADVEVALGRSQEESGDLAGAEAAYRDALKKDPRRADAEVRLAVLAEERGERKQADEHFDRAVKLAPNDPDVLCDRGYSYYLQRRWADAEGCFRKAIKKDSRHARSHNNLGLVLARQGEREAALVEFAKAGCDRADAQSNLALVLAMEGRLEDARAIYAEVAAAKPASAAAREGLRAADAALAARSAPPDFLPGEALAAAVPAPIPARSRPRAARTPP
ncbi:tetratricopeptide repeat protein [Planctomyces sp. SH-PL62]|uniref:tetratricopeptide repeat protein n=1 Tax=Planctomyces sp. SH-PL62 TaxID=1636152 RepID=UPI00078EDDD7|nr:tetratricopeptide repeat protein [Planctomyces sp. SH-PL62]AMV38182.1 photosystem I assembly protein Ycf3 [Planctomyces sp. SH-PL62]